MSETVEIYRAVKDHRKEQRALLGMDCPGCPKIQPKRTPTRLMPGQTCRVCSYRDMRDAEVIA